MENNNGNKVLVIILVAALAMACGFAGGVLSQKFYYDNTLAPLLQESGTNTQSSGDSTKIADYSQQIDSIRQALEDEVKAREDMESQETGSSDSDSTATKIAEAVMPSVVSVTTVYEETYSGGMSIDDLLNPFGYGYGRGGQGRTYEASCVGTGFIVNKNGYIVTNAHVVNNGNFKKITISLYDGTDVEGNVLYCDSTLDLAIVKIEKTGLKAVTLGDSDNVKIGSYAAAIGNPLGLTFERSITQGIISGLNRTITVDDGTTMEGLMQTDAAINSGNSGGPLLDSKGRVIGIASAKAASGESMGFAIPINVVKPIVEQVVSTGSFDRVYLGISAVGIEEQSGVSSEALIEYYGSDKGIYIAAITEGSGAAKAGLQAKDVILSIDGVKVGTMNKVYSTLLNYKAGDKVKLEVLRDGKSLNFEVILMTEDQMQPSA